MKAPIAKKSTANQRNELNIEKYIQWVTSYDANADNTSSV